jgi:hypothetical protein
MDFDQSIAKKRSLGALRKNLKTKPRSPDLTGTIRLQPHTIQAIIKQLEETESDEVIANIAGWANHDSSGKYLTVELSPRYVSQEPQTPKRSSLDFSFNNEEE